jgi:hypothetical protein
MAKTFMRMVADAQAKVLAGSPAEVQGRLQEDPSVLLIDGRDTEGAHLSCEVRKCT